MDRPSDNRISAFAAALGLVTASLAGCGIGDPVAQPQLAQASADLTDSAPLAINGENGENGEDGSPAGLFHSQVEVWLVATAEVDASLGTSVDVMVPLQEDAETNVFSGSLIEARSYSGIRIIFRDPFVTLEEGATLDLVTGPVVLDAETTLFIEPGDDVVVERDLTTELDASGGGTVNVLVDLNSRAWLPSASLDPEADTGTVPEAVFAAEVDVTGEVVAGP